MTDTEGMLRADLLHEIHVIFSRHMQFVDISKGVLNLKIQVDICERRRFAQERTFPSRFLNFLEMQIEL